jgi:hypothetical protein
MDESKCLSERQAVRLIAADISESCIPPIPILVRVVSSPLPIRARKDGDDWQDDKSTYRNIWRI